MNIKLERELDDCIVSETRIRTRTQTWCWLLILTNTKNLAMSDSFKIVEIQLPLETVSKKKHTKIWSVRRSTEWMNQSTNLIEDDTVYIYIYILVPLLSLSLSLIEVKRHNNRYIRYGYLPLILGLLETIFHHPTFCEYFWLMYHKK